MSSPAVGAFWDGEAAPGRLVDGSGNGHDLTQVGDPGNPTTPAPVFHGAKWLFGGAGGGNNYTFPDGILTDWSDRFTWEFGIRVDTGVVNGTLMLYQDDNVNFQALQINTVGPDIQLQYLDSEGGSVSLGTFAPDTNHHIKIKMAASGDADGTCYIDDVLTATFGRTWAADPIGTKRLPNNPTDANIYVDAFMIGQGWDNVYPGIPAGPSAALLDCRRRR